MAKRMTLTQFVRYFRGFIPLILRESVSVLEDTAQNIKERMNRPGSAITYPVNWDSEKQKQAFFATNGFGHGIPYQRQGNMEKAFEVSQSGFNTVNLFAPSPAGAVFGSPKHNWWQSNIHKNRWQWLKEVYFEEVAKIPSALADRFRTVVGNS